MRMISTSAEPVSQTMVASAVSVMMSTQASASPQAVNKQRHLGRKHMAVHAVRFAEQELEDSGQ